AAPVRRAGGRQRRGPAGLPRQAGPGAVPGGGQPARAARGRGGGAGGRAAGRGGRAAGRVRPGGGRGPVQVADGGDAAGGRGRGRARPVRAVGRGAGAGGPAMTPWILAYEGFDPDRERLREALCTLGNGRFATRGATPDGRLRTPGTYAAGVYNRLTSTVAGREVTNEDMVNLPDWLPLEFATPGCDYFRPEEADLLEYRHTLDMRAGVLVRELRWRDAEGRITRVRQRRVVSMADCSLAALETVFTAENWSGSMRVRAWLEGDVRNCGVARYRDLRGDHLTEHATGVEDGLTWLTATTRNSRITAALAARMDAPGRAGLTSEPTRVTSTHMLDLVEGEPATV